MGPSSADRYHTYISDDDDGYVMFEVAKPADWKYSIDMLQNMLIDVYIFKSTLFFIFPCIYVAMYLFFFHLSH